MANKRNHGAGIADEAPLLLDAPAPARRRESERIVAAAVLQVPRLADDLAGLVSESDFSDVLYATVWRVVLSLRRANRAADVGAVADVLLASGLLEGVGGYGALAELLTAFAGNPRHHARVVRDLARLQRLQWAGEAILDRARHPTGPVDQMIHESEQLLFALAEQTVAQAAVPLSQCLEEVFQALKSRDERHAAGQGAAVLSGLSSLDDITSGLRPQELTILAARPSVGKTSIALALARVAAGHGHAVLFSSLEQSRVELAERLLCAEGRVDSRALRLPPVGASVREHLQGCALAVDGLPLWVDDTFTQSVFHIAACARRLKRQHGLGLVVIDYVQLIEVEDKKVRRHEQVGEISRRLKALARELEVPVIALAQLNREVEQRGASARPRLSDLKESGSLEQDADVVILLHRAPDAVGDTIDLEILVAKQRNGPTGDCAVRFVRSQLRFEDLPEGAQSSPFG